MDKEQAKDIFMKTFPLILIMSGLIPLILFGAQSSDGLGQQPYSNSIIEEFSPLVDRVAEVGLSKGLPGPLNIQSNWVPVVLCPYATGGANITPGVLAAARTFQNGRVFAIGHPGVSSSSFLLHDNSRLCRNVVYWLAGKDKGSLCVRRTKHSNGTEGNLVASLAYEGWTVRAIPKDRGLTFSDIEGCDVLIYASRWEPITPEEAEAVSAFVKNGGGVFLMGLGWSYKSYVKKPLAEFPMNQIGARMGLMFTDGFLCDPIDNGGKLQNPIFRCFFPATKYQRKEISAKKEISPKMSQAFGKATKSLPAPDKQELTVAELDAKIMSLNGKVIEVKANDFEFLSQITEHQYRVECEYWKSGDNLLGSIYVYFSEEEALEFFQDSVDRGLGPSEEFFVHIKAGKAYAVGKRYRKSKKEYQW